MDKAGGVDKLVIGLEDEAETLKQRLTRGTTALDFVSIVGMGGIGKTTMARKVYKELEYHFHISAFCCVSQTYEKTMLFLEILPQVSQLPNRTEEMSFEDLGELLYRSLKGRRYLIVMDDVWDIGAWKDLGIYFPNDNNGSRILFTSRQNNVVLQIKPDVVPHCLRLLSKTESWELLEKTAFDQRDCPPELLGVGMKIAKSCQGLPLAVIVVAGILARTEKEQDKWEQIAESTVRTDAQAECSHIFELSYKHLPEHLKPCFLYLAAFQEDSHIPVRKLVQLWMAEGFIPRVVHQHSEALGEDYLMELTGRNLVMVSERRSLGGSKMCHLHDLVLDFCLRKAKEENFMQLIHGKDWLPAFGSLDASSPRMCSYYRGKLDNTSVFLFNPSLSSLLLFHSYFGNLKDFLFIPSLKHLTVLDLVGAWITEDFFNLDLPVHLRFLAVYGIIECIPPSLSQLSKLETFLVKTTLGKPIDLPYSIWEMAMLRHLQIDGNASFKLPEPRGKLKNLQTLYLLHSSRDGEEILKSLPGLRRLKCYVLKSVGLQFNFLTQLESLHVDCSWELEMLRHQKIDGDTSFKLPEPRWKFENPQSHCLLSSSRDLGEILNALPGLGRQKCSVLNPERLQFNLLTQLEPLHRDCSSSFPPFYIPNWFPLNLKKLTISDNVIHPREISAIGTLPNLEVLKILFGGFESGIWYMTGEKFLKLKYLMLRNSTIERWDVFGIHFPYLEKLVVHGCDKLESIPLSIGEIPTLQLIDVKSCSDSVINSVRQIQEEQIDMGNEELKIRIYPQY